MNNRKMVPNSSPSGKSLPHTSPPGTSGPASTARTNNLGKIKDGIEDHFTKDGRQPSNVLSGYGQIFQYIGNIGLHAKDKNLKEIGEAGSSIAGGAAAGFSVASLPGAVVGGVVGLLSYTTQHRRNKKNAKKNGKFLENIQKNQQMVNQNLTAIIHICESIGNMLCNLSQAQKEMYREQIRMHTNLIASIRFIVANIKELSEQEQLHHMENRDSSARILQQTERISTQIKNSNYNTIKAGLESDWNEAEGWEKSFTKIPSYALINSYKKLYDIIKLNDGKGNRNAAYPVFNGVELLESYEIPEEEFKNSNMLYQRTRQAFNNNSSGTLAELIGYLAGYSNAIFGWQLGANSIQEECKMDINALFNPTIWCEGVDRYFEYNEKFIEQNGALDPEDKNLNNIIHAGENFKKFIKFLQSDKPLNILHDYLKAVEELENTILNGYLNLASSGQADRATRLEAYRHFLQINTELNNDRNKLDALLNVFKACCNLAGYRREHLDLINTLPDSNALIRRMLDDSNSPHAGTPQYAFPYFHLEIARKIYVNTNANSSDTSHPSLNIASRNGLYNILYAQINNKDYFQSKFYSDVNIRIINLENLKKHRHEVCKNPKIANEISTHSNADDSKQDFKKSFEETLANYKEDCAQWLSDEFINQISIEKKADKSYFFLDSEIKGARNDLQQIENEIQNSSLDWRMLTTKLKSLNKNCIKIHKNFKYLLRANYVKSDNDVLYLYEDYKKHLPKLEKILSVIKKPEHKPAKKEIDPRQDDLLEFIFRDDSFGKLMSANCEELIVPETFYSKPDSCFMTDAQRQLILLYEMYKFQDGFLNSARKVMDGEMVTALLFGQKALIRLHALTLGNQTTTFDENTKNQFRQYLNVLVQVRNCKIPFYLCIHTGGKHENSHFTTLCVQRSNKGVQFRYIDSLQDNRNPSVSYTAIKESIKTTLSEIFALPTSAIEEVSTNYSRQQHMPQTGFHNMECGMHNVFNTLHMLTSPNGINADMSTMHRELKINKQLGFPLSNRSGNGGLDPEAALELADYYRTLCQKVNARFTPAENNNTQANNNIAKNANPVSEVDPKKNLSIVRKQHRINRLVSIMLTNPVCSEAINAANFAQQSISELNNIRNQFQASSAPDEKLQAEKYANLNTRYAELSRKRATVVILLRSQLDLHELPVFWIEDYKTSAITFSNTAININNNMQALQYIVEARVAATLAENGVKKAEHNKIQIEGLFNEMSKLQLNADDINSSKINQKFCLDQIGVATTAASDSNDHYQAVIDASRTIPLSLNIVLHHRTQALLKSRASITASDSTDEALNMVKNIYQGVLNRTNTQAGLDCPLTKFKAKHGWG